MEFHTSFFQIILGQSQILQDSLQGKCYMRGIMS